MQKFPCLLLVLKRSLICVCIICMTVSLIRFFTAQVLLAIARVLFRKFCTENTILKFLYWLRYAIFLAYFSYIIMSSCFKIRAWRAFKSWNNFIAIKKYVLSSVSVYSFLYFLDLFQFQWFLMFYKYLIQCSCGLGETCKTWKMSPFFKILI